LHDPYGMPYECYSSYFVERFGQGRPHSRAFTGCENYSGGGHLPTIFMKHFGCRETKLAVLLALAVASSHVVIDIGRQLD